MFIDDLVARGNYGVTLTIAYARGIAASGEDQTSTYFVFMNSDFVLADGSLEALARRMATGRSCIMAASLRGCAEAIVPALRRAVDTEHVLAMDARSLVRLALDNLHGTVVAKTVNQSFVSCATYNQFYWTVDGSTLLARNHLIFMLAIKPERPIRSVNSYCDYGFVPELVPSGDITVVGDSDEIFMLELQPQAQELEMLRCGVKPIEAIAEELSTWTTPEHRRIALHDTVFHAEDLPLGLEAARLEADRFVRDVQALMTDPVPHEDHYFWVGGVRSWILLRKTVDGDAFELPPELDDGSGEYRAVARPPFSASALRPFQRPTAMAYLRGVPSALKRRVFGAKPNVPIWHPEWQDCRLLSRWLDLASPPADGKTLLVWDASTYIPRRVRNDGRFDVCYGREDFHARAKGLDARRLLPDGKNDLPFFSGAAIFLRRADVVNARELIEAVSAHLKPDAPVSLYIDHPAAERDPSNFSVELASYVGAVLPKGWLSAHVSAYFVGGHAKRRLALQLGGLIDGLRPRSPWDVVRAIFSIIGLPFLVAATALNNLQSDEPTQACPDWCTSALLNLNRRADVVMLPRAREAAARAAADRESNEGIEVESMQRG
ncbi:MAG: hypothetical protein GC189_13780 [Alphaproteobacteria bacterium]|nr:hypothetical protein [Alphaproteobacteria bacterium]